jgi:two-component system response regulator HydG
MTRESSHPQAEADAGPVSLSGPAGEFEAQLRQVAASPASVLLEGESGSGKSAAARRLHAHGPRASAPIVEVSLAALSPTLVEAELFGHEEGAFTGAHKRRSGRFQRADGGTLVLDGIESLGAELQVKLLRVLQEQVVEPLGGEEVPIDVRVVATSTRDLQAEVEAGRFREDLYYRLAVITLRVPPLRVRLDELEQLLEHFLAGAAARLKVEHRPFSSEALEALRSHSWPGNLRELENAVERVLVLAPASRGPVLADELDFLGAESRDDARELAARALGLGLKVEDLERAMIEEALAEQRGNLSAAARQLGLSRRALDYRRTRHQAGEAE